MLAICADTILRLPVNVDLQGGYWELHNPLHTVWMPKGIRRDYAVEDLHAYIQLTDGLGTFIAGLTMEEMDLANPKRNRLMKRSDPIVFELDSPWEVLEQTVSLGIVPIPKPGLYRFRLMFEGTELEGGSAYLRVLTGESP